MSYLDYEKLETIAPAQFQQANPIHGSTPLEYEETKRLCPGLNARMQAPRPFNLLLQGALLLPGIPRNLLRYLGRNHRVTSRRQMHVGPKVESLG